MNSISRAASPAVGDGFASDAWPREEGSFVEGSDAAVADPFDGFPAVDAKQAAFAPIVDRVDGLDLLDPSEGHGLFLDPRDPLDGLEGVDPLLGWLLAAAGDGVHGDTEPLDAVGLVWDGVSTAPVEGAAVGETFTERDLVAMDDWSRLAPPTLLPLGSADGFAAQEFATTPIVSDVETEEDGVDGVDDRVFPGFLPGVVPGFFPASLAEDGTAFIA